MEDVIDLIATGASPSEVSDKMKDVLYAKAAERIDIARPYVANAMFGQEFEYPELQDEIENEFDDEIVDELESDSDIEEE